MGFLEWSALFVAIALIIASYVAALTLKDDPPETSGSLSSMHRYSTVFPAEDILRIAAIIRAGQAMSLKEELGERTWWVLGYALSVTLGTAPHVIGAMAPPDLSTEPAIAAALESVAEQGTLSDPGEPGAPRVVGLGPLAGILLQAMLAIIARYFAR